MIVVQKITLVWTKRSRGGEGAQRRAAVPLAFELPAFPAGDAAYHVLLSHEHSGFATRDVERRPSLPERDACVLFERRGDGLRVGYQWAGACGAPRRGAVSPRWLMELRLGDYGRVLHNGRFSGEDHWWYQQIVFNVAIADVVASDLFTRVAPTVTADLRERLR